MRGPEQRINNGLIYRVPQTQVRARCEHSEFQDSV